MSSAAASAALNSLTGRLGATRVDDGLLVIDSEYVLPCHADDAKVLGELPGIIDTPCRDWVYLDTETSGLSGGVGNLAFMVGVARRIGTARLLVRQYVIAAFAAERAMLNDLATWVGEDATLVSYNGKCFDVPLLDARCALGRCARRWSALPHLDLLYPVRRAFRRHWPDCRLQTAERLLLAVQREDDLPGAMAPAAWRDWLSGGHWDALTGVVRHNFQDVVSLALLHRRLADVYRGAVGQPVDLAAIGRAWLLAGRSDRALALWEGARMRLDRRARLMLASLYRQQRDWRRAEALWLELHAAGCVAAASELSKYHEHQRRDIERATRYAADCAAPERSQRLRRLATKRRPVAQLQLWE